MSLQDIFYLTNILSQVLLSSLLIFIFFITLNLTAEIKKAVESVRVAALNAQEKSTLNLPPLNTSLFIFNFVKNLISKKRNGQ
ncbi:MAG: hypothetical protein WCT01_02180 [Candidatus Shapirobacteria bacterium]|jgi:hypothetical protein